MQHVPASTRVKVEPGIWKRQLADGTTTYEITYRDSDGKQRRKATGPRLADARTALATVKAKMGSGQRVAPAPRSLTVAKAAEHWLETIDVRPATRAAYRTSLEMHVLPAFGRCRLDAVDVAAIVKWIRHAKTLAYRVERDQRAHPGARTRPRQPYRAATLNRALEALSRVYGHAIRFLGYGGQNPVRALLPGERPSDEAVLPVILSPAELRRVVEQAREPYALALDLLAGNGARISEVLGLVWGDVDLKAGTLAFRYGLNRAGQRVALKTRKSLAHHRPAGRARAAPAAGQAGRGRLVRRRARVRRCQRRHAAEAPLDRPRPGGRVQGRGGARGAPARPAPQPRLAVALRGRPAAIRVGPARALVRGDDGDDLQPRNPRRGRPPAGAFAPRCHLRSRGLSWRRGSSVAATGEPW